MERLNLIILTAALQFANTAWSGPINLMPLIDPNQDAIEGKWRLSDGVLRSDETLQARIQIPFQPPDEYDFRIIFARQTSKGDVLQFLSKGGRPFYWVMGGWNNTVFGFGDINGIRANKNPTAVMNPVCLKNQARYMSVVSVRRDGVKAYLDNKLITQFKTDYKDFSLGTPWTMRDPHLLGLGSRGSATVFYKIELVEIAGKGRVRSAPGSVK